MYQIGRPWEAPEWRRCPSRATSVAVSKPSPKRTPSGYMCQLLADHSERRTEDAGQQAAIAR